MVLEAGNSKARLFNTWCRLSACVSLWRKVGGERLTVSAYGGRLDINGDRTHLFVRMPSQQVSFLEDRALWTSLAQHWPLIMTALRVKFLRHS